MGSEMCIRDRKVPTSPPSLRELELPEHVNVLFLQTVDEINLPQDTIQGLKSLLYDNRDTSRPVRVRRRPTALEPYILD